MTGAGRGGGGGTRATPALRAGRWRRFARTLALFALLLQTGLALQYPTMAAGGFGAGSASMPHPAMEMPPDPGAHHGKGGKGDGSGSKEPACPVCQALQHIGSFLAAPDFVAVAAPRFDAAVPATPIGAPPCCDPACSVPHSRAPPMTV